MEGVKFETPFMSERASLFLSSIGLLGEYCPTSRKKTSCAETIGCMHLELLGGHRKARDLGFSFMRPFPAAQRTLGPFEDTATATYLF